MIEMTTKADMRHKEFNLVQQMERYLIGDKMERMALIRDCYGNKASLKAFEEKRKRCREQMEQLIERKIREKQELAMFGLTTPLNHSGPRGLVSKRSSNVATDRAKTSVN